MIRNTRLLEVLMDALKIEIDEEISCGIEHHIKDMFTDALCTLLKHPRICVLTAMQFQRASAICRFLFSQSFIFSVDKR